MTNLYALIVGIEKYDLPDWNRSGPVAGAIEMAYWCHKMGMPIKNIHMFLSVNDQDPAWVKIQRETLQHFRKLGARVVEDTSLNTIDTFWRTTLPTLPSGDSKLLVYWCGHGVTRPDRDRVLLHSDYNPQRLSGRVTSINNFRATLATQAYGRFQEQLIVADVCGDFREQVSPNAQVPASPVTSILQHCYFASLDGESTQIQNGIGEFTKSTLEILDQYQEWPDLDTLQNQMDQRFCNGNSKSCKVSIRTPTRDYDDGDRKSDSAFESNSQPNAQEVQLLVDRVKSSIKENDFDTIFQSLDTFLANAESNAFDDPRDSLQILQSDFSIFRTGEINGTLLPDPNTHRRTLISKIQKLLKLIESKAKQDRTERLPPLPSSKQSASTFFDDQVRNLLNGCSDISNACCSVLSADNQKVESDLVVDHLMGLGGQNTTEYPLLRWRRLVKKLLDTKQVFDDSFRSFFVSMLDILSVASFPDEDRNRTETAMQEVLRSNPEIGSKVHLNTALPRDVERLLVLTRLKLSSNKSADFDIVQMLNHNYREGEAHSPFLEFVRPVIVPEPTFPPDGGMTTSHYARCILESLGISQPDTDFEASLNHELKERKGTDGDGEVIALLLSDESSKSAQILREAFPLLLVIVLKRQSATRYSTILQDRHAIEQNFNKMLRTRQK